LPLLDGTAVALDNEKTVYVPPHAFDVTRIASGTPLAGTVIDGIAPPVDRLKQDDGEAMSPVLKLSFAQFIEYESGGDGF